MTRAQHIASWTITLFVPFFLVLTIVRLVLVTPFYLQVEYRLPYFPADSYGFTTQDRLKWGNIAREYLVNQEGIEFLGDLRFPDGTPVYNERELRHMLDVKNVVRLTTSAWYLIAGVLALLGVWARGSKWAPGYLNGLRRGGWLTLILIGAIILFVILGFQVFFVAFHSVFFAPGTWTFLYSDTLIRLFPEVFWRDIFLVVGLLTALGGFLLWRLIPLGGKTS
ncbi:MAG: TIGR01906 family membrane protein [Anaerolineales bacterium]|nr:TIGR01906 family membrane protein [Anaerolineales bacterium]